MQIAIVGYAADGEVSAQYFADRGDTITICDQDEHIVVPDGLQSQLGPEYLHDMGRFDLIVRSSGIHPQVILEANPEVADRITTSVNEFLAACPTANTIGITGTKGKGTTSTLVAAMLEAAGNTVHLGGNIGNSPLGFIADVKLDDWVVLELSSFQLFDITRSPHLAACLMVVPEHLNWHSDMADYTGAKSRLFEWQNSDDVAIYFAENENSKDIAHAGSGKKLPYYASPGAWLNGNMITIDGQEICTTDEIKLLGRHNWQNVCAAITVVWQAGVHDISAIRSAVTSFTGLEHRLEFVRELEGVKYYDDSFGTTPDTAIVAVEAFERPKVIILGGSDKRSSYNELAKTVAASNVRRVVLIGDQAERIRASLDEVGFSDTTDDVHNMIEIVDAARAAAQPGDVVLLSPACASYDMFKNYKDRGNQFKQAVQALV